VQQRAVKSLAASLMAVLLLVVVDQVLFGLGWFWRFPPSFPRDLENLTWTQVYEVARRVETFDSPSPSNVVVGDSAIVFGVDADVINDDLEAAGVPSRSLVLGINGATASDSSLVAWTARGARPWLVIMGLSSGDFRDRSPALTPVLRTFYDASADLPFAREIGIAGRGDAYVRWIWKLYRYRAFARLALQGELDDLWSVPEGHDGARPSTTSRPTLPRRGRVWFSPERISAVAFSLWQDWRQSGRFEDYLEWLHAKGSRNLLQVYRSNTKRGLAPEQSAHFRSVEWVLPVLRDRGVRVVLISTPENPVFRVPEAQAYFDGALSDRYAVALSELAAAHGARFLDLRDSLSAVDFEDLMHANRVGRRKLSARIAEIVVEEWKAAEDARTLASR
jgi:hypothetical protein